jgi:hypothetical protein
VASASHPLPPSEQRQDGATPTDAMGGSGARADRLQGIGGFGGAASLLLPASSVGRTPSLGCPTSRATRDGAASLGLLVTKAGRPPPSVGATLDDLLLPDSVLHLKSSINYIFVSSVNQMHGQLERR